MAPECGGRDRPRARRRGQRPTLLGYVVLASESMEARALLGQGEASPARGGPPCMRRGQAKFADLLLHVDRDWLILRLAAEHNRLGDFLGHVLPEVAKVRRRLYTPPCRLDLGAQT